MGKTDILVSVETCEDNRTNITVTQLSGDGVLTHGEMAHCLAGGISLLIKFIGDHSNDKDYNVMKEVIDYLNNEFVSTTSFSDVRIIVGEGL